MALFFIIEFLLLYGKKVHGITRFTECLFSVFKVISCYRILSSFLSIGWLLCVCVCFFFRYRVIVWFVMFFTQWKLCPMEITRVCAESSFFHRLFRDHRAYIRISVIDWKWSSRYATSVAELLQNCNTSVTQRWDTTGVALGHDWSFSRGLIEPCWYT